MSTTDYETDDLASIRVVLDATLEATLGSTFTFEDFVGPGEESDADWSAPIHTDDGLPRGGVYFSWTYPEGVDDFLDGTKRQRQAMVRFSIRRQPSPTAGYMNDILTAKKEIVDRFHDLATAARIPYAAQGSFPDGVGNGWQETGFFLPVWFT